MIKEAEGQAQAVLKVQQATAEGLRMIKEAGADESVLTLKSLEALTKLLTARQRRSSFRPRYRASQAGNISEGNHDR